MTPAIAKSIAAKVQKDGVAFVPGCHLSFDQAETLRGFLVKRPTYNSHVKRMSDGVAKTFSERLIAKEPVWCWSLEDAVAAPHLLDVARAAIPVAQEYLGIERPLLYSMNVWTTTRFGVRKPDIQEFHRDPDDTKFLALFVAVDLLGLTDNGFEIVPPDGPVKLVQPRPGEVYMADTSLMHRGLKPKTHWRTMAWARFGVSDPPAAYVYDKLAPVSAPEHYHRMTPFERYVCKLIVKE